MRYRSINRRGSTLPLIAVSMVMLAGFLALSIDLGIMAVAKTQCQNAADAAAIAGARTLNGTTSGNTTAATTTAQAAGAANLVLANTLQSSAIAISNGAYHYDSTSQTFYPQIPPVSPDNYNLTQATVSFSNPTAFGKIFKTSSFSLTATATAANRPRDVAIVLDFSGSMNNETDLWNCESYLGSMLNTPNNTDTVFPQWGWYAPSFSANATLQCTSTNPLVGACNITTSVQGVPALVNDFYSNTRGSAASSAFTVPSGVTSTAPTGDTFLAVKNSSTPAVNWLQITGEQVDDLQPAIRIFTDTRRGPAIGARRSSSGPLTRTRPTTGARSSSFLSDGVTPCNDNTQLCDSNGNWQTPTGNYVINYKAILNWIVNTSPNPFPTPASRRQHPVLRERFPPTCRPAPTRIANPNSQHHQPGPAILEGIHRLRDRRLAGPDRQHPNPRQLRLAATARTSPAARRGQHVRSPARTPSSPTGRTSIESQRQSAAAAAPLLVRAGDHDPVHARHRASCRAPVHDISMVRGQAGYRRAPCRTSRTTIPTTWCRSTCSARPTFTRRPTGVGQFDQPHHAWPQLHDD